MMTIFKHRNFVDNKLRVYFDPFFPSVSPFCTRFPTLRASDKCPYPGMLVEMLDVITKEAGLQIVPYIKEDVCPNSPCENHFVHPFLLNGTIDLTAAGREITDERLESFDFSEYLYTVRTQIIQHSRDYQYEKIFSFFRSYDSKVWMAILMIWLIQWICCVLSQQLDVYNCKGKPISLMESAWSILRLQLLQHRDLHYQPNASSRLSMSIFSFFQGYILLGLFSCFILASTLKPRQIHDNPIDLLVNRVRDKEYRLVVRTDSNWFFEKINTSNAFPFPEIKHSLEENPHEVIRNEEQAFQTAKEENVILLQQTDDHGFYLVRRHCDLVALGEAMPMASAHFMMAKRHPFLPRINTAIKATRARLSSIEQKYKLLAERYDKCSRKIARFRKQPLSPYIGALIVCAGFIIIAFIVLFVEKMYFKINTKMQQMHWCSRKRLIYC